MTQRILALCVLVSVVLPSVVLAAEGPTYNVAIDNLTTVPEPTTGLLLVLGLAALARHRPAAVESDR